MTITADWQAELAGLTLGAGTDYEFAAAIGGLGVPRPRTYDTSRGASSGEAAAADLPGKRVVSIQLWILGDTPADCWENVEALTAAWAPVSEDVTLTIRLPDTVVFELDGRPRGVDLDLTQLRDGVASALCTFEALEPTITVAGS